MNEAIAPALPGRSTLGRATLAAIVLLAFANAMSNRVLPAALYVPWNFGVAVLLVVLARRHLTNAELGLGEWRRGLQVGMVLLVATTALLLMGLAMPSINRLFEDRRVDSGIPTLIYQALIRIPLGTVVLEEIAFRSVLPAMFARRWNVVRGSIAASVFFGLWHVLPALNLNNVNPVARDVFGGGAGGKTVAILFAVFGTMLAGLWLCLIRYRARSVLASMFGHLATNSVGYTIAWFVART